MRLISKAIYHQEFFYGLTRIEPKVFVSWILLVEHVSLDRFYQRFLQCFVFFFLRQILKNHRRIENDRVQVDGQHFCRLQQRCHFALLFLAVNSWRNPARRKVPARFGSWSDVSRLLTPLFRIFYFIQHFLVVEVSLRSFLGSKTWTSDIYDLRKQSVLTPINGTATLLFARTIRISPPHFS